MIVGIAPWFELTPTSLVSLGPVWEEEESNAANGNAAVSNTNCSGKIVMN